MTMGLWLAHDDRRPLPAAARRLADYIEACATVEREAPRAPS